MEIPLQVCRRCKVEKEIFHFKRRKVKHGPPQLTNICSDCEKKALRKTDLDKMRQNQMLCYPWDSKKRH